MDAKPQRPLRAFKVRDENSIANVIPHKSIHQRNKSSPALSSLANQQASWRFGARRTAFADVSNTTRALQVIKDDSIFATTKSALVGLREVPAQEQTKPTAPLLKPAQRPLSVGGIKTFLGGFIPVASSNTVTRHPLSSAAATRLEDDQVNKLRQRKTIAVLKDVDVTSSIAAYETRDRALSDHLEILKEIDQADVVRVLDDKSLPRQPEKAEPAPTTTRSTSYLHHLPSLPTSTSELIDTQSNGVSIRGPTAPQLPAIHQASSSIIAEMYEDAHAHLPAPEPIRPANKHPLARIEEREPDVLPPLPPSEPAEIWDEEAYEERYEEEGYTTAKSLRSRADFTTGQTTIMLAPQMSSDVERELSAAARFMQDSRATEDIEDDEKWDTSMVAEYGEEIFSYMRILEDRMTPNPYYMDNQTEVQWSMRAVLMDWLIQVHHRFQLLPETLFLCVNYIDRFLSCKVVSINKLQLVGATAILVASKYEEIQCPTVAEIQYMVEGSYTVEEILKAERFMLSMLQFELGWPGPMSFLRRISKADSYDLETRTLAKYFLEVTIMDERFVACVPSFIAAGAHCLARLMLNKGIWSHAHVYHSGYTYGQLRPLIITMLGCCENPRKHHSAVFEKYGDKRFKRASYFVQTQLDQGFLLPSVPRGTPSLSSNLEAHGGSSYLL